MAAPSIDGPPPETVADLLKRLGDISPRRIRIDPPPGMATEKDVITAMEAPRKRLCELVDKVLVEKVMGAEESLLAAVIIKFLETFVEKLDLGIVLAPDATLRLMPGLVRIPDVSFISWKSLPEEEFPKEPIPDLLPDLAVEVLSKGNTRKEMVRKLEEYFRVGVKMVWLIQPKTQTAEIYASSTNLRTIAKNGALTGGRLLPGFVLPLKRIFERTKRRRSGR
jgi:Uma2 family endonuclease